MLLVVSAGACTPASLPTLPAATAQIETSSAGAAPGDMPPAETAIVASGSPTDAYTAVARRMLGCWFGGDGPLRPTHVFHADAKPPSQGGTAEIVIYERDPGQHDQRGVRAFRVSFDTAAQGVRVGIIALKVASPLAEAMVRDVEGWVRGGSGCQLRTASPPQAAAQQAPAQAVPPRPSKR
ncbi:MAG: hypothetical protein F9K29_19915 [Hyphomicrobiaceae bacterium]|nr:MAG: hypothetical protein F9K29_19915 [Hyphomicrobiaceae bacterium]